MPRLESIQNLFVGLSGKSQDKPVNSSAERSAMSKLLPNDNEWLNNLHQKANPNFGNPPERGEESFWVKLPPKRDAQTVRENLLRDNFGFDKADIAAYDRETKNRGLVVADSVKPDEWATPGEIGKWKVRGGYVEISVSKEKAAELRNFRVGRVIDKSLSGIGEPVLREAVKKDLLLATAGEGFNKTQAAERLLYLEVENPLDAETVRTAIRTVAAQSENRNNAVVQTIAARVELADIMKEASRTAPRTASDAHKFRQKTSEYHSDLEKTARLAGGFHKISDTRTPNLQVNRAEAAWVNRQAADIYRQLGDEPKAAEREMMTRYYRVDEAERNSIEFKIGGVTGSGFPIARVIPRHRAGDFPTPSMSAPPGKPAASQPPSEPPKKELSEEPYKLETRKYEKTYKIVETAWRDGKPTTQAQSGTVKGYERNFQMEGSLVSEGKKSFDTYKSTSKKGNLTERKIVGYETYRSPELNTDGRTRASVAAGGATLVEDWNKWMNFNSKGDAATKKLAAMDKAKVESFFKNNYPVPPAPKDLPGVKYQLETIVGKTKAKEMMKFIEEASYAIWGK